MLRTWSVGMRLTAERLSIPEPGYDFSASSHTGFGTSEAVSLTIASFRFAAETAYVATVKGLVYGTSGIQVHARLRKTDAAGTSWGEFGRYRCEGTSIADSAAMHGHTYLLRTASTDLVATVVLTVATDTSTASIYADASTPRSLLIAPIGAASDYTGLGVAVS